MGGQVKAVYVKQGDHVKKGQLLLKLDDAVTRQQIAQLKVQLDLAQTLYERRKNLWDKQIGTEVELLQAKTNVENLEKQIALLNEQHSMANVYAEISGVADMVNIKVGEYFTPSTAGMKGIRIVNTNALKVTVEVPENYLHKVDKGSQIEITLPDINKTVTSKVSVKGSIIDPSSRSFYIEAKIPSSKDFRPNQIALVRIQDYEADNAITIPMNTLQNDEKGKYVMVAVNENGKLLARKRQIEVGELYGNNLEVKAGLKPNDALITEGFQGLYLKKGIDNHNYKKNL
jgi:RND family efflux transporter MFP subunit